MSKFILLFSCFISTYTLAQWRATTPIRIELKDITFTDQYTGYALGRFGNFTSCSSTFALYKTIDAGEHWIKMKTDLASDAKRALHFVNPMVGWIAEEGSEVLKTTDGGVTWVSQTSGVGTTLNDIWFRDLNNGFLVGINGMLQRTTNGGTNWTTISSGVTASLTRIYFQSSTLGFITCSNGQVLRTANGGTSWTAINTGATNLYDVSFTSPSIGYALGTAGGVSYLYTTQNGGLTWTANNMSPYTFSTYARVFFTSSNVGYLKTGLNTVLKSTDAGATWVPTSPTLNGINDVWLEMYFTDDNTGFLCGNYGMINKTTDGGMTWENKTTAINDDILTISAPHKDTAYFGDNDGRIFKTTTGGVSYFQQVPDIGTQISKLSFLNTSVGFAAGPNGLLSKTTDGGAIWVPKLMNSTYAITDLSFPTEQIGYASAENGIVYKTSDMGETWNPIPTGTAYTFRDIYFTNPDSGYVTSSDRILRTFNGGSSWTEYDPSVSGIIQDIVFPGANMGYCVLSSSILKTEDAGWTWTLATNVPTGAVNELWFANDSSGYMTYTIGQRKTIDSCTTLISQSTACGTIGSMFAIEMTDGGAYGYAGGGAGGSTDGRIHQLETPEIIATQVSTGSYCAGATIFVGFFGKGLYDSGNTFTAELSDATGSFASPTIIGTYTNLDPYFVYQSGVITASIPGGTPAGSGYRIRVVSSAPAYIGPDNGFDIAIQSGQIPSVTITSATPGTICPGALLELNTATSAGGLNPTFQWTVNGNPIQNDASSLFIDTLQKWRSGASYPSILTGLCISGYGGLHYFYRFVFRYH